MFSGSQRSKSVVLKNFAPVPPKHLYNNYDTLLHYIAYNSCYLNRDSHKGYILCLIMLLHLERMKNFRRYYCEYLNKQETCFGLSYLFILINLFSSQP